MNENKIVIPFYVSTNNKHLVCLKVFIDIFNRFLPNQELRVLGYDLPDYDLPPNFSFISIGKQGGVNELSTDLRNYFLKSKEDYFIYGTEDVFLYKKPQIYFINYLSELIQYDVNVGRINLVDSTEDDNCTLPNSPHYNVILRKQFTKNECDWGSWELYEQTTESNYSLTTQISIWDRKFLLKYLDNGLSPWDFERSSFKTKDDPQYKVLMIDKNFPIYKKEGYSLGNWTNKEYWLPLLGDVVKNEVFGYSDEIVK